MIFGDVMSNKPIQITRQKSKKIEPFETGEVVELSKTEIALFDSIADLLEYPDHRWDLRFERCKNLCLSGDEAGSENFSSFCLDVSPLSILELQELYTRTFDLSPVCALEVGYHLFGEDYKRGEFLARLSGTESGYELGQEHQLPDYLPVLLRLLGQMDDSELRAALIGYCLIPALREMNSVLEKKKNPYGGVLRFLDETLRQIATESVSVPTRIDEPRCQYA